MPDAPVLDSGYAIARTTFPANAIEAAELLNTVDAQPELRVCLGDDLHLMILYLTADFVAFAYTHELSLLRVRLLLRSRLITI
jgi:hypothetical protein